MKKLLMFLVCSATLCIAAGAQTIKIPTTGSADPLTNFTMPPSFTDVDKTASGIADILGSKLSLDGKQKTSALGAISSFLGEKQGILGLAKKNPADYLKAFNPLQSGLFGKLKGIMGATKFANFLKLKPGGTGAGNLLSNLFF